MWKPLISGGEAASACHLKIVIILPMWLALVKLNQLTDWLAGQGHQLCVAFDFLAQKFCTYSTHSLWSIGTWAHVLAIMAIETLYLTDKRKILHWKLPALWLHILSWYRKSVSITHSCLWCAAHINNYIWNCFRGHGPGRQEDGLISYAILFNRWCHQYSLSYQK